MQTIYLETSIICHLTDPPGTNPITRACQQLTQLWWHTPPRSIAHFCLRLCLQ